MNYKVVTWSERRRLAELHPHLWEARPDLIEPAFPANPVAISDDFPFLFYVLDGNQVVGSRKTIPDTATVGGEVRPWAWNFDTFIEAPYRGKGVGRGLVDLQLKELSRRGTICGAAFSAPAALRIYERLGYDVVGYAPRLSLLRTTGPFLKARLRNKAAVAVVSRVGDAALQAQQSLRRLFGQRPDCTVSSIEEPLFRRLFSQRVPINRCNFWGSAPDWILSRLRPADTLYQVTRSKERDPCIMFVLRDRVLEKSSSGRWPQAVRRLSLMHFEFLADDADLPKVLAAALEQFLARSSADVMDAVTSHPPLIEALQLRGFRSRGAGMSFAYKPPGEELSPTKLADWHLTHFCSDGFTFP